MMRAHIDAPGRTVAHPGVSVQNLEAAGIEPAPKIDVSRDQPGKWLSGEDSQKATVTATALPGKKVGIYVQHWSPDPRWIDVRWAEDGSRIEGLVQMAIHFVTEQETIADLFFQRRPPMSVVVVMAPGQVEP